MPRAGFLVLSSLAVSACIEVPASSSAPIHPADASSPLTSSLDAGARRPADAPPYSGSECDSLTQCASGSDAGTAFDASDGLGEIDLGPGSAGLQRPGQLPPSARRPKSAGELVITEIMTNPASVRDDEGEWFELFNPSQSQSLDLAGCSIDDGGTTRRVIPGPLQIAPGHFLVIARSAAAGVAADLVMSFSLGNEADAIAVLCDATEIDRVAYGAGFPLRAGASMALDPAQTDAHSNDQAAAWCAAVESYGPELGTPGRPNPSCTPDTEADAGAP